VIHTAKKPEPEIPEKVTVPDYGRLLPAEIAGFTTKGVYDADEQQHLSFTQGGGHGGSHPHMVHEFVSAIIEDRDPFPNASQSANWTSVGILAHESALQGGALIKLPDFTI
ncbi:MAG: gfo/Idh/MocA family oxidoreductase, partial [Cytophagaceae bacterium]